jgi:hypothetical protein
MPAAAQRRRDEPRPTVEAAEAEGFKGRPVDEPAGSLLAGSLAIGPGVLLHGIGHYYAGDKDTALGLFAAELAGVALTIAGLLVEGATENRGSVGGLRQGLIHAGLMLFAGSWGADMLGAFKGAVPLDADTTRTDGARLGLAYRYTDDPVTPFRHHLVLTLDVNAGWFYLRPKVDLEGQASLRQFELDLGGRLRGANPQEYLALGGQARRVENARFGFANFGAMGYLEGKLELGRWLPTLQNFYVFACSGYGWSGYQFEDRAETSPAIFAEVEFDDTFLVLTSGVAFNLGRRTHLDVAYVQDPTRDVPAFASGEGGLLEVSLVHQQRKALDIRFVGTVGDGFGVWLGMEYGL